jgi:hypothetical protein
VVWLILSTTNGPYYNAKSKGDNSYPYPSYNRILYSTLDLQKLSGHTAPQYVVSDIVELMPIVMSSVELVWPYFFKAYALCCSDGQGPNRD